MGLLDALRDPRFRSDLATNAGQLGQSMSNTIAEGATVPVDALAWLLRKGGVNIPQNPIGGSDWAAQQGLTRQVPQGAPKIAGETLGLLAPMAATKQGVNALATALRQGGDNLSKARTMNPQTGAIVWHGSPHTFPPTKNNPLGEFDASKIGTGEGAQAYGYGHYMGGAKETGESYSKLDPVGGKIPSPLRFVNGKEVQQGTGAYKAASLLDHMSVAQARKTVEGWLKTARPEEASYFQDVADTLRAIPSKSVVKQKAPGGSLYKVDLPDDQIAKMLDWELPLSQQPDAIQNIARSADIRTAPGSKASGIINAWREGRDVGVTAKGGDLHHAMTNFGKADPLAFAELLRSRGIPGIRYLDEGSRNIGKGTSNFVVFPGNENMLRILERNGQGLLK